MPYPIYSLTDAIRALAPGARVELWGRRVLDTSADAWHAANIITTHSARECAVLSVGDRGDPRIGECGELVDYCLLRLPTGSAPLVGPDRNLVAQQEAWADRPGATPTTS